jgi:hypothetical protein
VSHPNKIKQLGTSWQEWQASPPLSASRGYAVKPPQAGNLAAKEVFASCQTSKPEAFTQALPSTPESLYSLLARPESEPGPKMAAREARMPAAIQHEFSSEAERVANMLAFEFLRDGRYSAAHGPVEVPSLLRAATAVAVADDGSASGFGNLAVQSVGFDEGTSEPALHIYLTRGSAKLIKSLPVQVDGVTVTAHRMGAITVKPEAAATATNYGNFFERKGRVCCGSSCAPTSENCSGTLGALVRKNSSVGMYVLSNNHVLAGCNHVPLNQPILAPSNNDSRPTMRAPSEIARHHQIHELRSGDPNFVNPCDADLALALATDPSALSSWQGAADGYDTPASVTAPLSMMSVKKFGRTTGLTKGAVEARITSPVPVAYNSKNFKGIVWFSDVWTVRGHGGPFALSGDSGSLVVTKDGQAAIGLVFAANSTGEYAWIIPMPCVVGAFGGVDLVTSHGV